jgi:predicted GNAT superfamily acetyltransferase
MMPEITIKSLRRLADMRTVVDLQRVYWGEDVESVVPAHMLFSLATHGGHVLAAYDGAHLVGVLIGFLGTSEENETRPAMANLQIVSKRMVVLPEYRGHGIGYRLKLAQRDLAIQHGIRLITWTFDPLLAANAHLNVRKLGVVCQYYLEDYYGTDDEGGLATLGSSDRLLAEWWVTNRRVKERVSGVRSPLSLRHYLDANTDILNAARSGRFVEPAERVASPRSSLALVEIPPDWQLMQIEAPDIARRWRLHIREILKARFALGDTITDFVRDRDGERERAFYVLSRHSSSPGEADLLN